MNKRHAHYDTYDYPAYWKGRDYEHESEVLALESLLYNIESLHTVADIGGGYGRLIPHYLKKSKKVILAEPSAQLLDVAKATHKKDKKVSYLHTSIEDIEKHVKPSSLDTILMVRVMHHLSNPKKVIKTFSKLLKDDGLLILEFANKIHGKAMIANLCRGDLSFSLNVTPTDRRCADNQKEGIISFYNYHPSTIKKALKDCHFEILSTRSVSNVRNGLMKKHIPIETLLFLEKLLQKPLSHLYFGPSIFILAQKKA